MRVERRDVIRPGRADSQELDRRRHRVRRELATAGAGARTGVRLDLAQLVRTHLARGDRTDRLKDVHQCDVAAAMAAGGDRATVEGQSRDVDPDESHHGGRNRFVAAHDQDQAVEEMAARDQLNRIGDHLAAHERGLHPLGAHRDAIGHGDGVELHRGTPGGTDSGLYLLGEAAVVEVAGHGLDPAMPDADQRLAEVFAGEADCPQHGARAGTVVALRQSRALPLQRRRAVWIRHGLTLLEAPILPSEPVRCDDTQRGQQEPNERQHHRSDPA